MRASRLVRSIGPLLLVTGVTLPLTGCLLPPPPFGHPHYERYDRHDRHDGHRGYEAPRGDHHGRGHREWRGNRHDRSGYEQRERGPGRGHRD